MVATFSASRTWRAALLGREQETLFLDPAAKAAKAAVGFYDPVARDHDREGICAASRAHCAHRFRVAGTLCDPLVALPLAEANLFNCLMHRAAKPLGKGAVEWEAEGPTVAVEKVEDLILSRAKHLVGLECGCLN